MCQKEVIFLNKARLSKMNMESHRDKKNVKCDALEAD